MKQGLALLCTLTLLCGAKGAVILTLVEELVAIPNRKKHLAHKNPLRMRFMSMVMNLAGVMVWIQASHMQVCLKWI